MILVLCGLPGAGKSHWARRLQSFAPSSSSRKEGEDEVRVRHVEFDAVEAGLLREASKNDDDDDDSLNIWHRARLRALEQAEGILREEAPERAASRRLVLVLDDNMYYASMRREAYQLAARHGVGYGCVHVATPLEVALAQNKARPPGQAVSEEVIRRMHTKLQVPDPATRSWEANTVTIGNVKISEKREDKNETEMLRKIWGVIERGWATPAIVQTPSTEEEAAKEEDRRRTRESELHATELMLRKIIGVAMQLATAGGGVLGEKVSGLGARFSAAKAVMMRDAGEGSGVLLSRTQGLDGEQAEARNVLVGRLFGVLREKGREEEAAALVELERQTLAKLANM